MSKQYYWIKKTIQQYGLRPASQRKLSLFVMGCVALGYTSFLRKKMGISYKAIIILGRGDNVEILFNEKYVGQEMGKFIGQNFNRLEELTFAPAQKIYQKIWEKFRQAKKLLKKNPKKSLEMMVDFCPEYMGGLGIYNCFWRYLGNEEQKGKITLDLVRRIAKERELYVKLYPEMEKLFKRMVTLIGKKEKFAGDLLRFLTYTEMLKYIKGRLEIRKMLYTLMQRKKLYLYVYVEKEDKEKVYVDKKLIDTIYGEFYDVQDKNIKIIKGYATFGGRVVGRVYNLASSCESEPGRNFILVTGMTHPKDIMLVKKSKAIITDHGGVLSHAAIVSREMKKPCIISTKIATKVLKDGDLVEVNANQGIVKRLNT